MKQKLKGLTEPFIHRYCLLPENRIGTFFEKGMWTILNICQMGITIGGCVEPTEIH